jgi:hypothetical protein
MSEPLPLPLPLPMTSTPVPEAFRPVEPPRLMGRPALDTAYSLSALPPDAGPVRRLLTPLRDPQSWLDALWGVAGFVTGIVAFAVTGLVGAGPSIGHEPQQIGPESCGS